MRRFVICNATGEQVGEGVLWADGHLTYRLRDSEPRTLDTRLMKMVDAAGMPERVAGNPIDWLDPEPADCSYDLILGGPEVEPALFRQIRDGDPAILDGAEGRIEKTERGWRFVPKERA